ncbi:MAG: ATP-binding cassette domain-containing protein [Methanolinea sp.]|nr:ATP-binding cassette domain-containing protein [Methanolinea sp.]
MIRLQGIRQRILEIGDLSLPPGHTVITGWNGGGKTTLLRLIAGLELPRTGSITLDGRTPGDIVCGWVNEFPGKNMLFSLVRDEISSPLRFAHLPCDEVSRRVEECAEWAGISHLLSRKTHTLSGGEQVLTSLATALIGRPEILVLDEFDSYLDYRTADVIEERILASGARYIFQCTQNPELASRADRVVLLSRGRVRAFGSPGDVFSGLEQCCYYPPSWRLARGTDI